MYSTILSLQFIAFTALKHCIIYISCNKTVFTNKPQINLAVNNIKKYSFKCNGDWVNQYFTEKKQQQKSVLHLISHFYLIIIVGGSLLHVIWWYYLALSVKTTPN